MLHHDIVINSDNIPIFLINEKSQDNLLINVLKNIDINEEIPMMVEKNDLAKRWGVESAIHSISHNTSILILSEKSNDTQGSCSIKVRKNLEIADIASKLTSTIADPIEFRIEGSICDNNDRNDDRTSSESIESNAENSLDAYRCSANEAVLVNTSRENEFISIGPSANVKPEYLTNYIFCEEVNHPHLFANENVCFKQREKCSSPRPNILISSCWITCWIVHLIQIAYFLLTQSCKESISAIRLILQEKGYLKSFDNWYA